MANDPSYLVGPMFHGTRVGTGRLISGFRPEGAPKQDPVQRTAFDLGGSRRDNYPLRFGPGLYVTNSLSEASSYAQKDNKTGGAVVEGNISPDNPIHLNESELDEIGFSKSSKDLVDRISKKPGYTNIFPQSVRRMSTEEAISTVKGAKNFSEVDASGVLKYFEHQKKIGDQVEVMPVMHNNSLVTGAHRTAANLQLRGGHDYMHILNRSPWGPEERSEYGVILRPNLRGYPAIFKARQMHFFDSIDRSKNT